MKGWLIFIFLSGQVVGAVPPPPPQTPPPSAPSLAPAPVVSKKNLGAPPSPSGETTTSPPPTAAEPKTTLSQLSGGFSSELESFLEPYIYDPKTGRDPFKPYMEAKPLEEGELSGPLLPLQQYDIDQLKLVGIIWNVTDPKALVVDPKSQVHVVRRDERIGRRNGYVAVIREGEVVVVEAVNVKGDLMYSTRVLKMKTKANQSTK